MVGISSCLLGNAVRFDGGHKGQVWLIKELGQQVQWHVLCPEFEMGLGVPRESIRLVKEGETIRLIGNETELDLTALAAKTAKRLIAALPPLQGFIFKKDSPSCGLERVKVEQKGGHSARDGQGIFATALVTKYPELPVIEEGRLTDAEQREHFVTRVYALHRWNALAPTIPALQLFHQRYKYLLMAHSPKSVAQLGRLAANSDRQPISIVFAHYRTLFLEALAKGTTPGRRYNVLQHLFGYVKDRVEAKERKALWEELEGYHSGEVAFQTVVSLLRHTSRRVGVPYLEQNLFWDPHPKGLGLRKYLA